MDGLPLDDAIKLDKRSFCSFYCEQLLYFQDILKTFCNVEPLKPHPIKEIIFILSFSLSTFSNALLYAGSYISERFYSTEKEDFSYYLKRSFGRIAASSVITIIVNYLISLVYGAEGKVKNVLKREKNFDVIKLEFAKIIKEMRRNFIILFIINYILMAFFLIYCTCFCNVYKNSQASFFIGVALSFAVIQVWPIIWLFAVTCLRFLGMKLKVSKIYDFSSKLSQKF